MFTLRTNHERRYRRLEGFVGGALWLSCNVSTLLWQAPAHGFVEVSVQGKATITASAEQATDSGELRLSGAIKDELGAPIRNATVSIEAKGADDSNIPLGDIATCSEPSFARTKLEHVGLSESKGTAGAASLRAVAVNGDFCLRVSSSNLPPIARIQLAFADSKNFNAAPLTINVTETGRHLHGSIRDLPTKLSLDDEVTRFKLVLEQAQTPKSSENVLPFTVEIRDETSGSQPTLQKTITARVGGETDITLTSKELGNAGPARLRLFFPGSSKLEHFQLEQRILRTLNVSVDATVHPSNVVAGKAIRLSMSASSRRGRIRTGAVELSEDGGLHAVLPLDAHGLAVFELSAPNEDGALELDLQYIPAHEWLLASRPRRISLHASARSKLDVAAWLVAGLLVLAWLVWSRRAPSVKQSSSALSKSATPVRARVEHLGALSGQALGWAGSVVDAHDEQTIANARILLLEKGFGDAQIRFETRTDVGGNFLIPQELSNVTASCELAVHAENYSSFRVAVPPQGQFKVHLVTARRTLLEQLVSWAKLRGAPFNSAAEPTPGWVAKLAGERGLREIQNWAVAVSSAAFGVESPTEATVKQLQPPGSPTPATGPAHTRIVRPR